MKKHTTILGVFAALLVLSLASVVQAQEAGGGGAAMGVGAETVLVPGGAAGGLDVGGAGEFVYDTGQFHIDALFLFYSMEDTVTVFGLGGNFYYRIHGGASSDLSIGGGLALVNINPDQAGAESETDIVVNGGAKIRAFITPNVALHTTLGLSLYMDDDGNTTSNVFGISGRLMGNLGITYFFR